MNRDEQYNRLHAINKYDICIIGAGATGAGIALDATLRGLKVLLIDKGDFAGQTSSKSTKLIHGGVRYLEQAVKTLDLEQLKMVRKSLNERDVLIKNAPHLTSRLPLLTPCYNWFEGIYLTIGLKIYEWISGKHTIGASRWLSKKETLKRIPELKSDKIKSGVLYYDGQLDDARYCLAIIQKAEELGATVLNYVQALDFNKEDGSKKLKALNIKDIPTAEIINVKADVFVNATGPFTDHIRKMANSDLAPRMTVSRGAHIVLPAETMKGNTAMLIPKTDDGRVLFIIPWQDSVLVGTTDDADKLSDKVKVEKEEIPYLLNYVNRYFNKQVVASDIKGGFAGQRPLLNKSSNDADTKSLVRDHEIEVDNTSQLVSIMGGKWTTYRLMAEDTVDHIFDTVLKKASPACSTETQLLYGGENYDFNLWKRLTTEYNISEATAQHVLKKYGSKAVEVLNLTKEDATLKELLVPNHPFIKAEIIYCINNEMVVNSTDILERRLGLSLRDEDAAKSIETEIKTLLKLFGDNFLESSKKEAHVELIID